MAIEVVLPRLNCYEKTLKTKKITDKKGKRK
jgi:hypothetical protein